MSSTQIVWLRRDLRLAEDLWRQDREINRLNREIFGLAVRLGDDADIREWTMTMTMVVLMRQYPIPYITPRRHFTQLASMPHPNLVVSQ